MESFINKFVSIMTIDIIVLIGVLLLTLWLMTMKPANYPPGPPKWPIVGNLFQIRVRGQVHLGMSKLNEKYGEVAGMFVGNAPLVLISGPDAIREATIREDLAGRPNNVFQKLLNKGQSYGFVSINGEVWKAQRRFTLHHLRDFGFGKRTLEGIALDEIEAVFRDIDSISGGPDEDFRKPVCFHDILGGASINVLLHMMLGQRYDHNDPQFKDILTCVKNYFLSVTPDGGIIHAFPIIAKLFPSFTNMKGMQVARDAMHDFIQEEINVHRKMIDFEHPRDFLDVYLSEIEKQKADADTTFNDMQLKQICMDLFLGGTDTTLNSIHFALLYMILYPEVQKKIHAELDTIVGKDRLPSLADRANLPYLDAAIKEALRLGSVAPVGISHGPFTENSEISFRGYKIPKASTACINDGAHLAILNSEAESAVLRMLYARYPKVKDWAYVGFHDLNEEGKFVTIFGDPLTTTGFNRWYAGQPDNLEGNQDCGSIHRSGVLNDLFCDKNGPWPFICEYDISWSKI